MLRSALLEFVTAVHDRKPSLLTTYMGIVVDAMQQGDFPLTLSQLADSLAAYARSNAGALKLSNLVSAIVKEPTFATASSQIDEKSQIRTKSLLSLLVRIATVKPTAVSKYVNVCVQSCAPMGNTSLVGFVIPVAKLVAATALAGVDESYYSLETLCRLLRTYKNHEFTVEEQRVLLGAVDVAKNKCPKGDIFAEVTSLFSFTYYIPSLQPPSLSLNYIPHLDPLTLSLLTTYTYHTMTRRIHSKHLQQWQEHILVHMQTSSR